MARWLGIFFASGATLALVGLFLSDAPHRHTTATALLAASGYPVAALLLVDGRRLPMPLVQLLTAAGTLIVTLAIVLGEQSRLADVSPVFYMWVPIFAFTYFSFRAAVLQVAWIAASYGAVLGGEASRSSVGQWIVVVGVVAVTSAAVHGLVSQIRRLARTDPLTGLANRRVFDERLHAELTRAQRTRAPLCIAIIDLDNFKRINDELGHQAGDEVLIRLAPAWLPELRTNDCLARYGGDEFAVVLPNSTTEDANRVVGRLRAATPDLSFSVGIAACEPTDDEDILVTRADSRLYHVKRHRRASPGSPDHS